MRNIGLYVSEALARAYKLHVCFFMSVHLGGLPPPLNTKTLATLLLLVFAHQKSSQMKMAASVPPPPPPPHSLHEIAATVYSPPSGVLSYWSGAVYVQGRLK